MPYCGKGRLQSYRPNFAGQKGANPSLYALAVTDAGYEFICTNLDHLQDNLMPLQPRYDSQIGLTKITFQDVPTPQRSPKWLPGLVIFGLLGIIGLVAVRK